MTMHRQVSILGLICWVILSTASLSLAQNNTSKTPPTDNPVGSPKFLIENKGLAEFNAENDEIIEAVSPQEKNI
jgi:hypothetical protein